MEIPVENLRKDHRYSFTFNPAKQPCDYKHDHIKSFRKYLNHNLDLLDYCTIDVYCEMSKTGRFHYHGYITIHHIVSFILHDLPLLDKWCVYSIDTFYDWVWIAYCYKQKHLMKYYCDRSDIPYNINKHPYASVSRDMAIEGVNSRLGIPYESY